MTAHKTNEELRAEIYASLAVVAGGGIVALLIAFGTIAGLNVWRLIWRFGAAILL